MGLYCPLRLQSRVGLSVNIKQVVSIIAYARKEIDPGKRINDPGHRTWTGNFSVDEPECLKILLRRRGVTGERKCNTCVSNATHPASTHTRKLYGITFLYGSALQRAQRHV